MSRFNLWFDYFTCVLACLLILFSVLQGHSECLETETNGTTEVLTALIMATMSKNVELNSIVLEPSVHVINQSVNPTSDAEDAVQADELQYEDVEFDIDSLKDQLGIREILESLSTLSRKVSGQQETRLLVPESGTLPRSPDSGFDPSATILAEEGPTAQSNGSQMLESSETLLPSIFEETESFGPKVVGIIAERINDSCSKKPLDTKLKELQDKHKTPENCKVLCIPNVNLELWHDLPRATKTRDLGLQEKNIIKSAQPMLLLFNTIVKARAEKKSTLPMEILPMLADAVTLIGHASYLASLKRREFLKPVRFPPRSKDFFFASCGSLFPFTRANAQWVIHGFKVAL